MPKRKRPINTNQQRLVVLTDNASQPEILTTTPIPSCEMDLFFPQPFTGAGGCDPKAWITHYELYCKLKGLGVEGRRAGFLLSMKDIAALWIQTVQDIDSKVWDALRAEFIARFEPMDAGEIDKNKKIWTSVQGSTEPVRDFIDRITALSIGLDFTDALLLQAIQSGLKPSLRQFVARQQPKTVKELRDFAILAETTEFASAAVIPDTITNALQRLEEKLDRTHLAAISNNQLDRPRRGNDVRPFPSYRDSRSPSPPATYYRRPSPSGSRPSPPCTSQIFPQRSSSYRQEQSKSQLYGKRPGSDIFVTCFRCNGNHIPQNCRHIHQKCRFCFLVGHIERACRKRQKQYEQNY